MNRIARLMTVTVVLFKDDEAKESTVSCSLTIAENGDATTRQGIPALTTAASILGSLVLEAGLMGNQEREGAASPPKIEVPN